MGSGLTDAGSTPAASTNKKIPFNINKLSVIKGLFSTYNFYLKMQQRNCAMLVLTRTQSQSVHIFPTDSDDDRIIITIENISRGQVKLSFEAPDKVEILREELLNGG